MFIEVFSAPVKISEHSLERLLECRKSLDSRMREDMMKKDRFDFLCQEAQAGNDAFVFHKGDEEEGRVTRCTPQHLVVQTPEGETRCWDFGECEEMSRDKGEFPYR